MKNEGPHLVTYLESLMSLFIAIAQGRNEMTSALLRDWMPLDLLYSIMSDPVIVGTRQTPGHMRFTRRIVDLVRVLYVDNAPHVVMARFKAVRIWDNVDKTAEAGGLSSRLTTVLEQAIDWASFDQFKELIISFISMYDAQSGTEIEANHMVSGMLQLVHSLILHGFWPYSEIRAASAGRESLVTVLLRSIDGRADVQGPMAGAQVGDACVWVGDACVCETTLSAGSTST